MKERRETDEGEEGGGRRRRRRRMKERRELKGEWRGRGRWYTDGARGRKVLTGIGPELGPFKAS